MWKKLTLAFSALATALAGAGAVAQAGARLHWASVPLPAIDGGHHPPALFEGKVVLVVNTASRCGFTAQYDGLQKLWTEYRDRGLVVLGIPSNDFGGQEPGSNAQVQSFCRVNFGVDFPLLEKQVVTGPDAHYLFAWAAAKTGPAGTPKWNFHKYLIGRDGRLIDWFSSVTAPDAARVTATIEQALAEGGR